MPKWLIFYAITLLIHEKNVANYALLRRKTFSLNIWLCKFFDKYHVCPLSLVIYLAPVPGPGLGKAARIAWRRREDAITAEARFDHTQRLVSPSYSELLAAPHWALHHTCNCTVNSNLHIHRAFQHFHTEHWKSHILSHTSSYTKYILKQKGSCLPSRVHCNQQYLRAT